jgi:hypothetical protein
MCFLWGTNCIFIQVDNCEEIQSLKGYQYSFRALAYAYLDLGFPAKTLYIFPWAIFSAFCPYYPPWFYHYSIWYRVYIMTLWDKARARVPRNADHCGQYYVQGRRWHLSEGDVLTGPNCKHLVPRLWSTVCVTFCLILHTSSRQGQFDDCICFGCPLLQG